MRYRQVSRERCNIDPIAPHFYIVKLGFTIHYFLIFALKDRLRVFVRNHLIEAFDGLMRDWCRPNGLPSLNKEFTYLLTYFTLIYVLSKNKKMIKETLNRKLSFFSYYYSQYITQACFRNENDRNDQILN